MVFRLGQNTPFNCDELKATDCFNSVYQCLNTHLELPVRNTKIKKRVLHSIIAMSSERLSVHSLQSMENVLSETSMRHHLSKFSMQELENKAADLLLHPLDLLTKGKAYDFAIDVTLDPYYGKVTPENEKYILRGKRKKSTTRFYGYITLYTINRREKVTLAAFPVMAKTSLVDYLKQCLDVIRTSKFRIRVLCLDREFYSVDIFSYLKSEDVPFIVPTKRHGTEMKRILSRTSSGFEDYTIKSGEKSVDLTVAIAAINQMGKRKKKGRLALGYIIHGINKSPKQIMKTYKHRFGIESSYRIRNYVRAKTTTRNPVIRYLYALVSFLLKNVWMAIQWHFCSETKRGPMVIEKDWFRFDHFRLMLWDAAKRRIGAVGVLRRFRSIS